MWCLVLPGRTNDVHGAQVLGNLIYDTGTQEPTERFVERHCGSAKGHRATDWGVFRASLRVSASLLRNGRSPGVTAACNSNG